MSQRKFVTQTRERTDAITERVRIETVLEISVCSACAKERGMAVLNDDVDAMRAFTYRHQAEVAEKAS